MKTINIILKKFLNLFLGEKITNKILWIRRKGFLWFCYFQIIKFLYFINVKIIKFKTKKNIPDLEDFFVTKINLETEFLDRVKNDLKKKDYIFTKSFFSSKYMTWHFPTTYLNDVRYSWGFDRRYYANYIDKHLKDEIKKIYGGFNYRIELVEMFVTPKGTKNVNANFHVDGDNPGSLKMMIYLSDVDEESGPISFLDNKDDQIKKVLGDKGTVVFFNNRKAKHAGMPSISKDRTVLTFLLYPTLRKSINYVNTKPMNVFCNINPFSKFS